MQIEDGSADISLLQKWLVEKLPTDMVCSEAAKGLTGKTAVECAEAKGLVEVTELLGGNVELAEANLDELFAIKKDLIQTSYASKIESTPALKTAIADDVNKLLLHYLIENHSQIPYQVFAKFLADEELSIKTNVVFDGKTALEKCVELGYNDLALELAKQGVGTGTLDNGVNILNYCVTYGNNDLLKLLENDADIEVAEFEMPTKLHQVNPTTAIPLTPLLQAVLKGDIKIVVKLAKEGFGTTSLDNTNHVLNYVNNFAGDKKVEMAKALMDAGIDVTHEKAEQALVGVLHPVINPELVAIYIEGGVVAEEALELFVTHGLLSKIECLIMNGAEITPKIDKLIASKTLTAKVEEYKAAKTEMDAEIESTKPFTTKEKIKFVLTKISEGASVEDMTESYPRSDGIGEKFIRIYHSFKTTQAEKPSVFEKLCKMYKVALPVIVEESKEVFVDDLVSGTAGGVADPSTSDIMGDHDNVDDI